MSYRSLTSLSYLAGGLAALAENSFGLPLRDIVTRTARALGADRGRFSDGYDEIIDALLHGAN